MKKIYLLIMTLLLASCSSSSGGGNSNYNSPATPVPSSTAEIAMESTSSYAGDAYYDEVYYEYEEPISAEESTREEKRIITGNMNMSIKDYDSTVYDMRKLVEDSNGYVENYDNYISGSYGDYSGRGLKRGNITFRIPAEKYSDVKMQIEKLGRVTWSSESSSDASTEYYDIEARLTRKLTEEERLLEMISEAREIQDLIELEKRLSEVRTDIEIYQSRLSNIDMLVQYSTLHINLTEVTDETIAPLSDDLGDRIKNSFVNSINIIQFLFEFIVIFLAGAIIPILLIAILATVTIVIFKKSGNKKD